MDELDFFLKNVDLTARPEVYKYQLEKGGELSDWRKLAHRRGDSGNGPIKRGLGIGVNMWGGLGHDSKCRAIINADGSAEIQIGSQDLGVGTRTVIAQVAAQLAQDRRDRERRERAPAFGVVALDRVHQAERGDLKQVVQWLVEETRAGNERRALSRT